VPWGHTHKTQEEVFIVLEGSLRVKLENTVEELAPLDAIRVSKETMRGFEAGPEGVVMIAIGCPGGPGDAETTADWWTD
jgi:quercetin dioxygenase-like cupin family protein